MSEPYYDVIRPHGGVLIDRVLRGEMREAVRERAEQMPKIPLDPMGLSDLELIATGALSPLTGFMRKADYDRCVEDLRLANGVVWSVPVTLAVDQEQADAIKEGQEVALCEGERPLAVMEVTEKYPYGREVKEREAREVYQTTQEDHPGVARLYSRGDVILGGDIWWWIGPQPSRLNSPNCATPRPRRGVCSPDEAGAAWSASRPATRSIAPTSTYKRRRWRS